MKFFDLNPQSRVGIFQSCIFQCFREFWPAAVGFIFRGISILFFYLYLSISKLHYIEETFFEISKNKMATIFWIFIDWRKIIKFVNNLKTVTAPSDMSQTWQDDRSWPPWQCLFKGQSADTPRVTYKGHSAKIIVLAPPSFIF